MWTFAVQGSTVYNILGKVKPRDSKKINGCQGTWGRQGRTEGAVLEQ